jgi:polyisoprenyl-phosphate glycosyltransferase
MFSLIIPVYRNEGSIPPLLDAVKTLSSELKGRLEVVFVVDGSPDGSYAALHKLLPQSGVPAQLISHSRNFGSFAAIRTGMENATGEFMAVMAADLQEPPELVRRIFEVLELNKADIVIATRTRRQDPFLTRLASRIFWGIYRHFVQSEMPQGGADIFGCRRRVADHLIKLREANSSLVGLLFWVGFTRIYLPYERQARRHGASAWTLRRKVRYLMDSIFSFTDLPILLMIVGGLAGTLLSLLLGPVVLAAKLLGYVQVPGYAATALLVMFFGGLNAFGLGIIGTYVWRTFENTKGRPGSIVMSRIEFNKAAPESNR